MFTLNLEALKRISKIINDENLLWCIGGSFLLLQYDLVGEARDIDILVNEEEAVKLHELLLPLGEHVHFPPKEPYLTKYFFHHRINETEVDVIGGFKINHDQGIYDFVLDNDSISARIGINDITVPLSTLEDWFVLYQLIPNREDKVKLIEKHFLVNGLNRPQILKKALTKELPVVVRRRIEKLISGN